MNKKRQIWDKPRTWYGISLRALQKLTTRGWLVVSICFASVTLASVMPLKSGDALANLEGSIEHDSSSIEDSTLTEAYDYQHGGNVIRGKIEHAKEPTPVTSTEQWTTVNLERGDSLARILQKARIPADERNAIILADIKPFKKLIAGKELVYSKDRSGAIQEVRYTPGLTYSWRLYREQDQYHLEKLEHQLEVRQKTIQGTIQHSLFVDGQSAGLSIRNIMNLAEIFGWDIDFALDLRKGDRFSVIVEEKFYKNKKAAAGNILAAEIVNQGQSYRAIAHTDDQGRLRYYTPDGQSLRRTFLRSPVDFAYISSRFTKKRYHPVLKIWRAHKGVDYAARSGTPVRSTASGTISFVGRKGGYGNTVIIKHGGSYSTLYAHLSRFRNRLHKGQRVSQGQLIAYVGSTGLASGPHLHYEFRVNNTHRNPLQFRFPKSSPIEKKYRMDFLVVARKLDLELDSLNGSLKVANR